MVIVEYLFLLVMSVTFLYTEESTRRRDFVKCVCDECALESLHLHVTAAYS